MRVATLSLFTLVLAACSGASTVPAQDPPGVASATPARAEARPSPRASTTPKALPGLEGIELDTRDNNTFWALVSQLYAPCPSEAVSIAQCIEESRPCAACRPAARLLAEKVQAGITGDQARELYAVRFGPNLKEVDPADSPSLGPSDAPITIIVFSDFECPHCRHAMPLLDRALQKFSPRVRLVHKFYPLRQHSHAEAAARAAIAAHNQGKYWEMEKVLFGHQADLGDSDLERYAKELGLDMKRFRNDLQDKRTTKILERDHADGERAGLSGTPFILVNGREFDSTYFHVDPDLDAWIRLELELAGVTGKAVAR
ncbi:MAG: thioredoxin domain-containing protein [Minicystis sp.]